MTVGEFTELSLLVPQLLGADQASAIHALSHRLQGAGRIEDSLTFFQAALQRDYLSSSAIEGGMAFPHARAHGIHRFSLALGLSQGGGSLAGRLAGARGVSDWRSVCRSAVVSGRRVGAGAAIAAGRMVDHTDGVQPTRRVAGRAEQRGRERRGKH